jgi:hypothetical protein
MARRFAPASGAAASLNRVHNVQVIRRVTHRGKRSAKELNFVVRCITRLKLCAAPSGRELSRVSAGARAGHQLAGADTAPRLRSSPCIARLRLAPLVGGAAQLAPR